MPRCSAEPSEVGIRLGIIHHCEVLDCNAASLFQSYVSMKIQPSYTVAKKIWGSRGLNFVSPLEEFWCSFSQSASHLLMQEIASPLFLMLSETEV